MDKSTSCMQELPVTGENFRPQNIRANVISFLDLPDDVLFIVFQKCAIATLGRLCRVCHKLNYLIQSDCVWLGCSDVSLLVGSSITQPSRLCLYTRRWGSSQIWMMFILSLIVHCLNSGVLELPGRALEFEGFCRNFRVWCLVTYV